MLRGVASVSRGGRGSSRHTLQPGLLLLHHHVRSPAGDNAGLLGFHRALRDRLCTALTTSHHECLQIWLLPHWAENSLSRNEGLPALCPSTEPSLRTRSLMNTPSGVQRGQLRRNTHPAGLLVRVFLEAGQWIPESLRACSVMGRPRGPPKPTALLSVLHPLWEGTWGPETQRLAARNPRTVRGSAPRRVPASRAGLLCRPRTPGRRALTVRTCDLPGAGHRPSRAHFIHEET